MVNYVFMVKVHHYTFSPNDEASTELFPMTSILAAISEILLVTTKMVCFEIMMLNLIVLVK